MHRAGLVLRTRHQQTAFLQPLQQYKYSVILQVLLVFQLNLLQLEPTSSVFNLWGGKEHSALEDSTRFWMRLTWDEVTKT